MIMHIFFCENMIEKKEPFIRGIFILCIWLVIMFLCCREHVALPLRRYLDAEEMIKSIEGERFYRIGKNMWYSQNWIRISTKFFPKNAVVDIRTWVGGRGNTSLYVRTIWGKEYRCDGFRHRDKLFEPNLKQLIDVLPISKKLDLNSGIIRMISRDYTEPDLLAEYMKTHTTTELIESDELLSVVAEDIRNDIPYGRRRKK